MTQTEKDILLKDLCARLPYGVKGEKYTIRIDEEFVPLIDNEIIIAEDIITLNGCPGYMIRPYLFPLSSMTEEQREEYHKLLYDPEYGIHIDYFDWCHKNHFDCRGLIPLGLAIDATNKDIY
jgi:hypothetical protein